MPAGQRMCHLCRRAGALRDCAQCGSRFTPKVHSRKQRQRQETCSLTCALNRRYPTRLLSAEERAERERERSRQRNRRRRATLREVESEPYTLAEIATRDRFRCGLCGGRVGMFKPRFHPRSPVIDHVIPLIVGGSDLRVNVQLAHFFCNGSKGAAGGGEQLALIG